MSDIVGMLKATLELLTSLSMPTRAALVQPLVTVLILLLLYAGWHVRDEGDVASGLRVAFLDTRASRAAHEREVEAAILRAELYQAVESDKLLTQLLTALLQRAPLAARVRLAMIHNGVTGMTGVGLLRFDVTHAVAVPGRTGGAVALNQPLSDWGGILPGLLAGQCQLYRTAQFPNLASRARYQAMGASSILACPAIDVYGTLVAVLAVFWDGEDLPPSGEALASLMAYAKQIGSQIGAALDLRVPVPHLGDGRQRSPAPPPPRPPDFIDGMG